MATEPPTTPPDRTVGAIVAAAGVGSRLGADRPKALVPVGDRPLVVHALDRLAEAGLDSPVVVVHPPGTRDAFARACAGRRPAALAPGGRTRTDSVRAGLAALADGPELVAVHDAARGLCPPATIRAAVAAVGGRVLAAAPALRPVDTVKRVSGDRVVETVDRDTLRLVQTPQVFLRRALEVAFRRTDAPASDDLALVEAAVAAGALSGQVRLVEGSRWGDKITWPRDVRVAEAMIAGAGR